MLGHLDESGTYTLLKTDYLRKVIRHELLKPLINEMRSVGLIVRDDYYIEGQKSYGYRFTKRYSEAATIRLPCRVPKLNHQIQRLRNEDFRRYKRVHKHLFRWLNRLELDRLMAEQIIDQTDFSDSRLSIDEMRDMNRLSVQAIIEGRWEFGVCNYGRVHTLVTRLLKALRNRLMIDGKPLVTIDIANSQPLFLLAAIIDDLQANQTLPKAQKEPFGSRNPTPSSLHPYTPPISAEDTGIEPLTTSSQLPEDLNRYRMLCETGRLYEYLMARMGWTDGKAAFKDEELFRCLYGTNGSKDAEGKHSPSRLQPVLEADFPTVWNYIRAWKKRHGYRDLSCQMQREESRLMIEGVCGRLMVEHPDCPLVTIHDSIMTTPDWVETVRATIMAEFGRIGIQPTLHVE